MQAEGDHVEPGVDVAPEVVLGARGDDAEDELDGEEGEEEERHVVEDHASEE